MLLLIACSPDPGGSSPTGFGVGNTAVLATVSEDYATGALALVSLDDWSVNDTIADISGDPAVVSSGDRVFQLNRYGYDTVRVYEPDAFQEPLAEYALADLANPHDVEVCSGRAFISQYGADSLAVKDPDTGEDLGTVDLSGFADADGLPEASTLVQTNGRLYVGLHHLDRNDGWTSAGGAVAEVDCETAAVVNTWDIATPDLYPLSGGASSDGALVVSDNRSLFVLDNQGLGVPLVTLKADVVALGAWQDQAIVAIADDAGYEIGCVDIGTGSYTSIMDTSYYVTDVQVNALGQAWIAARTHWSAPAADKGTLVADVASCAMLTDQPIQTLLAPFSIAFY